MKITLTKPKMGHGSEIAFREQAVMEPLAIIVALTPPRRNSLNPKGPRRLAI